MVSKLVLSSRRRMIKCFSFVLDLVYIVIGTHMWNYK